MSAPIMAQTWNDAKPEKLKITLAPLDEFEMPMNRFAHQAKLPSDPKDYEEFATNAGALVKATVLFVLTGKHPFEEGTA